MHSLVETESKLPHLNPKYLEDVRTSCTCKCSEEQYKYMLEILENELDVVTYSMMNSSDWGFGFLKLAIHPGSTASSMAVIYEKVISQTPWKYRKTALAFIDAIDTLFKFCTKNPEALNKFEHKKLKGDQTKILDAISELTIMYLARLVNQDRLSMAS